MSVSPRKLRHPNDRFAAIIVDGVNNVRVEGVSFRSQSGTAVIVRDAQNITMTGGRAAGATGGISIHATKDSQFCFDEIIAFGVEGKELTVAEARSRIRSEINGARIPQSDKEKISEALNALFEDQEKVSTRERAEKFLANFANLSTALTFTWSIVSALYRGL